MRRIDFNDNWIVKEGVENAIASLFMPAESEVKTVRLPYDAMIHEKRNSDTRNGGQTGYYPGGKYTFLKEFEIENEWLSNDVFIEFEQVYKNASVYINDEYIGGHEYGYGVFRFKVDDYLKIGANTIKVIVDNSDEENSRWYSGSGILGGIDLLLGNEVYLKPVETFITAPQIDDELAVVKIDGTIVNSGVRSSKVNVEIQIFDKTGEKVGKESIWMTINKGKEETFRSRITVLEPSLWDCDNPNLYSCRIRILDLNANNKELDNEVISFGIRDIKLDALHGLRINGKETKLRGCCVHHDNGIIGAITLKSAELRKVRLLKEAGFNCIRMGHTPATRALIEACDEEGMLLIDEFADMWFTAKNSNDYGKYFRNCWEEDLSEMIKKDRNHPSIIFYSSGNELQEAGTVSGAICSRKISKLIRSLDDTRLITNAINELLAGTPIIKKMMLEELKKSQDKASDQGSNILNMLMSNSGSDIEKIYANPELIDMLREFTETIDVVGYNYDVSRDEIEKELHPNRMILASETYPSDVYRVWQSVCNHKNVLGEMTWTGMDYLGEAGIGVFYYDGNRAFAAPFPDNVAYCGDIDLNGQRRCVSYYREAVYGLSDTPYIQVERLTRKGQEVNKSKWAFKDYLDSWTWPGYEGKKCLIDVYSAADEVELLVNGKSLGRKKMIQEMQCIATYETTYYPGRLEAISYRNGIECGRYSLITAESPTTVKILCDSKTIRKGECAFIAIEISDDNGNVYPLAKNEIEAIVEGCGHIEGFGSANPRSESDYFEAKWEPYDGRLLLAVRGDALGEINITLLGEGLNSSILKIAVQE